MPAPDLSPIARALGRVPSGLFIVTSLDGPRPLGFVGSFVMQIGFQPPMVCLAVDLAREPLQVLRRRGAFALSVLDPASKSRMAPFLKRQPEGRSAFDGLPLGTTPGGLPYLSEALAWLECRVTSEHPSGDHAVLFAEVVAGAPLREGDPHVHVRRNGLAY